MSIRTFLTAQAIIALLALATVRAEDVSARVAIEFLNDGRCAVASEGDGFRSQATYKPPKAAERGELHCAMPPVPKGRIVALVVSLPTGARGPGASVPPLRWAEVQGRWVGTATLTDWPDSVVVSIGRGWTAPRNLVLGGAAIVILIVVVACTRWSRPRWTT